MSKFVQRIMTYLANEVIAKHLPHNKTFQAFAVRTDAQLNKLKQPLEQHMEKFAENPEKVVEDFSKHSSSYSSRLWSAMKKEFQSDLDYLFGGGKKGGGSGRTSKKS